VFGLELYCRINVTAKLKLSTVFGFSHYPNFQAPSFLLPQTPGQGSLTNMKKMISVLSIFSNSLQVFSHVAPRNIFFQASPIKPSGSQKLIPSKNMSK